MARVTHPLADSDRPLPSVVTGPDGTDYAIVDGVVDAPPSAVEDIADAWARRFDTDASALLTDDDTGCPFCDDYGGDNVGIHAAQAHPEQWADYQED